MILLSYEFNGDVVVLISRILFHRFHPKSLIKLLLRIIKNKMQIKNVFCIVRKKLIKLIF